MFASLQCKELCDSDCSSRLTEWLCPVPSLFIVLTPDVGTIKNGLTWCVFEQLMETSMCGNVDHMDYSDQQAD